MSSESINRDIEAASPATARLLSALGRDSVYPRDIPYQAAEARQARCNATIGQITDGKGHILAPQALRRGLGDVDADRALLYSPVDGVDAVRRLWSAWHRPAAHAAVDSSLPLVTVGLTHALSIVADLFCEPGRPVVIPAPFWGNYRQIFSLRRGGRIVPVEAYGGDGFEVESLLAAIDAIDAIDEGEPTIVICNIPSNPTGYSPTREQRDQLASGLLRCADRRPLLVVCDDAYAGLVWSPEVPRESLYWHLAGRHPSLVPVKIDGVTKELVFFGGRVGFLSFPFAPGSGAAAALESKAKCLLRATLGSPIAVSQELVRRCLEDPDLEAQLTAIRARLAARHETLAAALDLHLDAATPARALPFNSGCFTLLELSAGLDAEAMRQQLLAEASLGLVAIGERYLRIAYCSVARQQLDPLVADLAATLRRAVA